MKVFTLIKTSCSPKKGLNIFSSVYLDADSARASIAGDVNLVLQYGLGDDFGLPADGEDICLGGYKEGELVIDGGHNPEMVFKGDRLAVWYGHSDDNPRDISRYCVFRIQEAELFCQKGLTIPDWEFLFDENYPDTAGANMAGILTDGHSCLYWHVFKDKEDDSVERCHIYESIMMLPENELCVYDWTAENDSLLIRTLNGCDSGQIKDALKTLQWFDYPIQ